MTIFKPAMALEGGSTKAPGADQAEGKPVCLANVTFLRAAQGSTRPFGKDCFDPAEFGLRNDRMLNYVWLCRKRLEEPVAEGDPLTSVPLHYLDKAFADARTMPDVMVNLWLDSQQMNIATRFMVESHVYHHAPSNLVLRDLHMIDAYKNHRALGGEIRERVSILDRVDVARFMTLRHCLNASHIDRAYYKDFDAPPVDMDGDGINGVLDKKGIAFGAVEYGDALAGRERSRTISHGFIAVDRSGQKFLENDLLPNLENFPRFRKSVVSAMCDSLIARESSGAHYFGYGRPAEADKMLERYLTDVLMPDVDAIVPGAEKYAGISHPKVGLRL